MLKRRMLHKNGYTMYLFARKGDRYYWMTHTGNVYSGALRSPKPTRDHLLWPMVVCESDETIIDPNYIATHGVFPSDIVWALAPQVSESASDSVWTASDPVTGVATTQIRPTWSYIKALRQMTEAYLARGGNNGTVD